MKLECKADLRDYRDSYYMMNGQIVHIEVIHCAPLLDRESLYAYLHELGHARWGHRLCGYGIDSDVIQQEIDAWRYALQCVREEYKTEMIDFALPFLGAYVTESILTVAEQHDLIERMRNILEQED